MRIFKVLRALLVSIVAVVIVVIILHSVKLYYVRYKVESNVRIVNTSITQIYSISESGGGWGEYKNYTLVVDMGGHNYRIWVDKEGKIESTLLLE